MTNLLLSPCIFSTTFHMSKMGSSAPPRTLSYHLFLPLKTKIPPLKIKILPLKAHHPDRAGVYEWDHFLPYDDQATLEVLRSVLVVQIASILFQNRATPEVVLSLRTRQPPSFAESISLLKQNRSKVAGRNGDSEVTAVPHYLFDIGSSELLAISCMEALMRNRLLALKEIRFFLQSLEEILTLKSAELQSLVSAVAHEADKLESIEIGLDGLLIKENPSLDEFVKTDIGLPVSFHREDIEHIVKHLMSLNDSFIHLSTGIHPHVDLAEECSELEQANKNLFTAFDDPFTYEWTTKDKLRVDMTSIVVALRRSARAWKEGASKLFVM